MTDALMAETQRKHMTTSNAEPVGAIAMLKERATRDRSLNEFHEIPVTLQVTEAVAPSIQWDDGIKTVIELRAGAAYTIFRGDKDNAVMVHRQCAYRALADLLYRDVLRDLRQVIQAVGDGKRHEALQLLGDLYERLRS